MRKLPLLWTQTRQDTDSSFNFPLRSLGLPFRKSIQVATDLSLGQIRRPERDAETYSCTRVSSLPRDRARQWAKGERGSIRAKEGGTPSDELRSRFVPSKGGCSKHRSEQLNRAPRLRKDPPFAQIQELKPFSHQRNCGMIKATTLGRSVVHQLQ